MSGFRYAFTLSKGEVDEAVPPGTTFISIRSQQTHYRRTTDYDRELALSSQPSLDPCDPLNWPSWRKAAVLILMSLYAFIGNFTSTSIASAFPLYSTPLAFNPPISVGRLTHLVAVNVLMMGAANIWWVPLANTFGRRPVILINIIFLLLCSVWAGGAKSFGSLLAARCFMGVGVAPADTIAPNIIGEIYFTQERGKAMGFYTVLLCEGALVGGISGGYIAFNLGLEWIHLVNVILATILFVGCFFLVPETLYVREDPGQVANVTTNDAQKDTTHASDVMIENVDGPFAMHRQYQDFTFFRSLRLYSHQGNLMKNFAAPLMTLRLPGVWPVMLWYAGLVGGVVTFTTVGPTLVSYPPYSWGSNSGLIMVGGVIGSLIGAIATIAFADRAILTRTTIEEGGYVEPEARLPVALPGLILATIGLWTFGFSAQYPSKHMWIGMQFGVGMLSFGLMQGPSVGFNYVIDSYRPIAADCFVTITCMRAIISFAWTFFVGIWVEKAGPAIPFGVCGGIMGFFTLLLFPQWLWGKRTRIATAGWVA